MNIAELLKDYSNIESITLTLNKNDLDTLSGNLIAPKISIEAQLETQKSLTAKLKELDYFDHTQLSEVETKAHIEDLSKAITPTNRFFLEEVLVTTARTWKWNKLLSKHSSREELAPDVIETPEEWRSKDSKPVIFQGVMYPSFAELEKECKFGQEVRKTLFEAGYFTVLPSAEELNACTKVVFILDGKPYGSIEDCIKTTEYDRALVENKLYGEEISSFYLNQEVPGKMVGASWANYQSRSLKGAYLSLVAPFLKAGMTYV